MGGTPPIRGEQDRYTFSGMPIYRDDAASLESHDRLRFRLSDLDSFDNRGIDASRDEGQPDAILSSENPAGLPQSLQGVDDVTLEHNEIGGSLDNEMPSGQPCPARATYPTSSSGGNGQNGQSSSTAKPARRIQVRKIWKSKQRAMQSTLAGREGGPERRIYRINKSLVRSMRWIGQCCTCQDEGDEPTRQGIRLVEV